MRLCSRVCETEAVATHVPRCRLYGGHTLGWERGVVQGVVPGSVVVHFSEICLRRQSSVESPLGRHGDGLRLRSRFPRPFMLGAFVVRECPCTQRRADVRVTCRRAHHEILLVSSCFVVS